jgi:hypothetical protein
LAPKKRLELIYGGGGNDETPSSRNNQDISFKYGNIVGTQKVHMRRDFSPSEGPRSMSKDDQMSQTAKLTEPTVKERTLGGRVYFQKLNTKMDSRNGETK